MIKSILTSLLLLVNLFSGFAQGREVPYVILVSFDGFRSDYVNRFNLPNFKKFIAGGARADGLIPSFPSKTFPNHYTIVTGLYPGKHGLVDNQFFDPARETVYTMKLKEVVTDPYYYGGTPLWKLAREHNLKSASYFWVGSELKDENLRPDYYYPYKESVPFQERIDKVIDWLKLPEQERPHLIMLYFSSPDHESHSNGPLADETRKVVVRMDSLLGNLTKAVEEIPLPVNIILVSDHGMSELTETAGTYIFLNQYLVDKENSIKVVNAGTQAHVYIKNKKEIDTIYHKLKSEARNFTVVKRKDFPKQWHYDNERSGDLLIVANPKHYIVTGDEKEFLKNIEPNKKFGVHGYDPLLVKEMNGIFYAKGPNIKAGSRLKVFQNVHVYPLVAKILHLTTPTIDGDFKVLEKIYSE